MGKMVSDDAMDALLAYIADNGDKLFVCSAEPTTYTEASATYALADHDLVVGDGNGDYVIADGSASGRKLTLAQQASFVVDATGDATHVAICKSAATAEVLLVTTCTSQSLTAANTVTVPAFKHEIADPT